MFRSSLIVAGAALLCSTAMAQHQIDPARRQPVNVQLKHAGTVDVVTGKWTPAGAIQTKATQNVFNNTCTWTTINYYAGFGECEDSYDEGRVPSTSSPGAPLGAADSQLISLFEIAYCTYNATPTGGMNIEIAFWDKLNGHCVGGIAPTPPSWSSLASASAYFNLAGLGLPGSTANGFQGCWSVGITNLGYTMQSDGEGVFDNDNAEDKFIWGKRINDATPVIGSPNGFFISGDPVFAPEGSCSYNIPCLTDVWTGLPCGTGLGAWDGSWINVDGIGVGSSAGTPAGCTSSVAVYGYGTNCYWFGGYPTNVFDSYWLRLESEGGTGVGTFCTSKPSSIPGCTPTLSGTGSSVSKSGAPAYTVTAAPVPGGGGKPGIMIYSKNGLLGNPANTPFGLLCIANLLRFGQFPGVPGGTSGQCDGTYNWNLAQAVASAPALAAGNQIWVQAWYRDPTNPGTANFTEGIGPIDVTP